VRKAHHGRTGAMRVRVVRLGTSKCGIHSSGRLRPKLFTVSVGALPRLRGRDPFWFVLNKSPVWVLTHRSLVNGSSYSVTAPRSFRPGHANSSKLCGSKGRSTVASSDRPLLKER
jgi:hypothetical protein